MLKIAAKDVPLPLTGPLGAIGVRVTTGTLRNCALFDAATIRLDVAGKFIARGAVATSLADCSDVALGAPTTTSTSTSTTSSTMTTSTTTTVTTTSSTSTTFTGPGCGNGVVESGEECDTLDPGICLDGISEGCGAPGTPGACLCCSNTLCSQERPCCNPTDQCALGPGGNGTCYPTVCGGPGGCTPPTQADCCSDSCGAGGTCDP